jgi:rhamnogalacturonyl hydrolase YesR
MIAFVLAAALAGPAPGRFEAYVRAGADSLVARHVDALDGWAWRSAIQSPHLQTDRDVGAASVAMGFLAAWQTTRDRRYLDAARHAGDWLLAAAQPAESGVKWPDYDDSPQRISSTHFTSFDDGAAGISDLLWRLYQTTGDMRYRTGALAGMAWLKSQARGADGAPCPGECRWTWFENGSSIYTGIGQGIAGIGYTFDAFAERTGDPSYERYALSAAAYLERRMTDDGAIPEQPGTTAFDTGFLNGSAGDAFFFLRMYQRTGNARYLADARRLLTWVRSEERRQPVGVAWPIMIDPRHGNDNKLAAGVEEGNAGIGWVELQAYEITGDPVDRQSAVASGDWLTAIALANDDGLSWQEDLGRPLVHTSLDNGAPGIGWYLDDLWRVTGDARYEAGALAAAQWLESVAAMDRRGVYWFEHQVGAPDSDQWRLPYEPSWHWGTAGIVAYFARLDGWAVDIPGEEPAL